MSDELSREQNIARLRYSCRRGMLELDALLARFISSSQFAQLTAEQIKNFERLLDETDPQLLSWFMGQEICNDVKLRELIKMIGVRDIGVAS